MRKTLRLILIPALLTGCAYHGPDAVRMTRPEYNIAIQQTNEQELLLNLVRLRYRDTPYFMNVEKVASSVDFSRSASALASLPEQGSKSFGLGGSFTFAEKPTLFYAPLEGEKFVRQMMTPLSPDTLILLTNSGWSVERVFAVTLQEMNGLKNAPTASGPTPAREPEFWEFRMALKHLRALQIRKLVDLGRVNNGGDSYLELRFAKDAAGDADARRFRQLLDLDPMRDRYRLTTGIGQADAGSIVVSTRSLIATLNYLAQGVEAPPRDVEAGRVTRTLNEKDQPFDWQKLLGGVFRVTATEARPEDAAVAVHYRNAWFQIRDNDLESKATFSLLAQLLALQGGQIAGAGPAINFSISQ